eukprot:9267434-Alexandrium_andersonii.AAC.1
MHTCEVTAARLKARCRMGVILEGQAARYATLTCMLPTRCLAQLVHHGLASVWPPMAACHEGALQWTPAAVTQCAPYRRDEVMLRTHEPRPGP